MRVTKPCSRLFLLLYFPKSSHSISLLCKRRKKEYRNCVRKMALGEKEEEFSHCEFIYVSSEIRHCGRKDETANSSIQMEFNATSHLTLFGYVFEFDMWEISSEATRAVSDSLESHYLNL